MTSEAPSPRTPSGVEVTMRFDRQRVVVVEVGGAIREYTVGERRVLDGYGADEMCSGARGQILVPWPNRIKDGRYLFEGQTLQLPLTEVDKHNAIHGLVRWANWQIALAEPAHVIMRHTLFSQPGWPFILVLENEYRLDERGLSVRTTATNVGARACPYGSGAHPYLTLDEPTIDGALVRIPARLHLPTDGQQIPTGHRPVEGTRFDFRRERALGDVELDTTYTELERDGDGLARVTMRSSDGARAVTLWADAAHPFLEVFTGDTLERTDKRRTGLGVEPMTCAPNAFGSGDGLRTLRPGESFSARWGIDPSLPHGHSEREKP